jgi:hypothetical protein
MRTLVLIALLSILMSSASLAKADEPQPCSHVRLTGSVAVGRYMFKNYEAINPDVDSACVRMLLNGRVVYTLGDDAAEQYSLGQTGDRRNKIPRVPNGADLTGEGRPDMIVTSWSGGAHCCYTHYVFELEPKFRLLAKIDDGDTDLAHFEKLDNNRGYSYVTSDIWSYWPSSFASSVSHAVLLRWDGDKFRLDLEKMRKPPPTAQQWKAALKDVDDALKDGGDTRGALGVTLWDTVLDLVYTGHSDLAWKFVREANPEALKGDNPRLEEFCIGLKGGPYWADLQPTIKDTPEECAKAKSKAEK